MEREDEWGLASSLCRRKFGLWVIASHESDGWSPGLGGGDRGFPAGRGSRLKWCASADGGGAGWRFRVRSQAPESESESDLMGGRHARVWAARRRGRLKRKTGIGV